MVIINMFQIDVRDTLKVISQRFLVYDIIIDMGRKYGQNDYGKGLK